MQERDRSAYLNLFQRLQDKYEEEFPFPENARLTPKYIFSDMECAFLSAAETFYRNSTQKLCLVHLSNAFDKKMVELFGVNYKSISNLKTIIFVFMGSGTCSKVLCELHF